MNPERIYLDHAATSPLRPEARAAWEECAQDSGFNPASAHGHGRRAHDVLESARARLASLLSAAPREVVWTGGGTQADNLAVLGFARAHAGARPLLVVPATEHKAVLAAARRAEREGAELVVLPVDTAGAVDPAELERVLAGPAERPTLVSVMWANNETGVVQPVQELCRIAQAAGASFHTDAVQALGKLPISLAAVPADLLTVTAHKIGGPVGIGALVVRGEVALEPLVYGGAQEGGLWPGTQNPLGAAAFAAAATAAVEELSGMVRCWMEMRGTLEAQLRSGIPRLVVHSQGARERLPQLLSVGIPGADSATLLMSLDLAGISVSSGSACSSGSQTGSHVLSAMGVELVSPYAVLRFSFGPSTTVDEVERAGGLAIRAAGQARAVAEG